jgi:hypothetical protein
MRILAFAAVAPCLAAADLPPHPGHPFAPPPVPSTPEAPVVYEHTATAGPDETFLLAGDRLAPNLVAWGVGPSDPRGQVWRPRVLFCTNGLLAATLPEKANDGVFVVRVTNAAGGSAPVVLNRPEAWWCAPEAPAPGGTVRVFGRNLAVRPDADRAFVFVSRGGRHARCEVLEAGPYALALRLPAGLEPGACELRVHAGSGGEWGWSEPLPLRVAAPAKAPGATTRLGAGATAEDLRRAIARLAERGGGTVTLPAGEFHFGGTLRIPAGVTLAGAGMDETRLVLDHDPAAMFGPTAASGWNQGPSSIHTVGDRIGYSLDVPRAGRYAVWLRYATEMSPWKMAGVSSNHALAVDGGAPVPLDHLTNTGGFGAFAWSRAATLDLAAGKRSLEWRNLRGGGVSLDAFVFCADPAFTPSDALMRPGASAGNPPPLVLQAENCERFVAKDGQLPGGDRAAVWLSGDGATVRDLSIHGNAQANLGIAIRSPEPLAWVRNCRVEGVRVADCDGKQAENCGVHLRNADGAAVVGSELGGRTPLFLGGARRCEFARNRLVPSTRFGGNAEAAILGRCEPLEQCIIEDNLLASPPGAAAGGPTTRRMVWVSTGHGSVANNWIARNGVENPGAAGQPRFGGVAGMEQNVGEMILFEGNHRTAYFGPLAGAGAQDVTLPRTIPTTPDARLGNVKREQLAHDAEGRETPFLPPDADDGSPEPPVGEYFVTVFSGVGRGQTRRVVRREGDRWGVDRPWRVPPAAGSVVAIGTAFHRNHVVGNHAPDGMTGVQLWISCIENIVAGNTVERQRKPGLFLYANGTTLASSMPRTWNRGISPLFWNVAEGNRCDECSVGALVTSGESPGLPIEFPRALGNVLRHNSFIRSRDEGVLVAARGRKPGEDATAAIAGTIVEFNVVRDAATGYRAGPGADATVFRRDHAYFWYPVNVSTNAPVGFRLDDPAAVAVVEENTVEGKAGTFGAGVVEVQRGPAAK